MDRLTNVETYNEIVTQANEKHGKALLTNCYLLPEKITQFANAGRLTYNVSDSGVVMLCDMDFYYSLYFFINPNIPIETMNPDKPVSLEFISIEGRRDPFFETMSAYWKDAGFKLNSRRRRLYAEYTEEDVAQLECEYEVIHQVETAGPELFDEALELLLATFNPLTNLFRSRDDMRRLMAEGWFLCVKDKGRIIAIVEYEYERGLFKMWRIATDRAYRGHHLHWHCRSYVARKAWDLGYRKTTAWIEDGNDISTHNIKKLRMDYDGRFSEQYVFTAPL